MEENQNISLAERALQIYDEQQDLEFLRFLVAQRRQDQQLEPMLRDEWERGTLILKDDSMVKLNDQFRQGKTSFRWHNGIASRPARIESGSLPAYPGAVKPLLDWPSSKTLLHAILKKLEQDGWEQVMPNVNWDPGWDPGNEPVLEEYDILTAAPGLNDAILEFMRERYDMPDFLLNILEREVEECAGMIVKKMPEETITALRQATETRMREENREQ